MRNGPVPCRVSRGHWSGGTDPILPLAGTWKDPAASGNEPVPRAHRQRITCQRKQRNLAVPFAISTNATFNADARRFGSTPPRVIPAITAGSGLSKRN